LLRLLPSHSTRRVALHEVAGSCCPCGSAGPRWTRGVLKIF